MKQQWAPEQNTREAETSNLEDMSWRAQLGTEKNKTCNERDKTQNETKPNINVNNKNTHHDNYSDCLRATSGWTPRPAQRQFGSAPAHLQPEWVWNMDG